MYSTRNKTGLVSGPLILTLMLLADAPSGMEPAAWRTAAVAVMMAIWWITEAVPLPVTALLPIILFPALGVLTPQQSTAPYANHLIFLFLGGFFIAATMEKWDLHRRIALYTIKCIGTSPGRIILGFMIATAFLSMWISNTATTMMMVPIAMAVTGQAGVSGRGTGRTGDGGSEKSRFGTSLMLGIAYSASIGGVGTIIGTPPNVILAGFIESTYGTQIGFVSWMAFGVPLAIAMLALTWFYLVRIAYPPETDRLPGGREYIRKELSGLGRMTKEERSILAVFLLVSAGWIARSLFRTGFFSGISDSTIAMAGALLLFMIPSDLGRGEFLLDWKTALKVPWGVILLFGGGLSLAGAFRSSGLDVWIGNQLVMLGGLHYVAMISAVVLLTVFLTEMTSNTATSAMLIPVAGSIALSMAIHPYGLVVAAGVSASYAFMLPVATPPNAIVFGSGKVEIGQMVRAGLVMNIISWIMITLLITFLLPLVWDVDLSVLPAGFGG